jgi:hypothetical protein
LESSVAALTQWREKLQSAFLGITQKSENIVNEREESENQAAEYAAENGHFGEWDNPLVNEAVHHAPQRITN